MRGAGERGSLALEGDHQGALGLVQLRHLGLQVAQGALAAAGVGVAVAVDLRRAAGEGRVAFTARRPPAPPEKPLEGFLKGKRVSAYAFIECIE